MLTHTFLCWGMRRTPEVHVLTCWEMDKYVERITIESADAPDGFTTACTFGLGFDYAVPARQQAMETLALEYVGKWQDRLRYMAACLAIGEPIEPEDGSGGERVPLRPIGPRMPPQGGHAMPVERLPSLLVPQAE